MKQYKTTFRLLLAAYIAASCAFLPALRTQAAPPPIALSRTSLEETDAKCAKTDDFCVTYVFGDKEVAIDSEATMTWFVTSASLTRMQAETEEDPKPYSGRFLIDGKESAFPETVLLENGFVTDPEGHLVISESAMYESMKLLFDQYNMNAAEGSTVFHSTSGRTIFFGSDPEPIAEVDLEKEYHILKEAFLNKQSDIRRVIHREKAETDIETVGENYIEVDVAEQMMYLYLEGELKLSTPVVTGNLAAGNGTPQGVYPIISKARNARLMDNYFAYYWLGFTYRGHGIHDALWRNTFGGTIYRYAGSHGCVNTPIDMVSQFFDLAYPGMPVVVFY